MKDLTPLFYLQDIDVDFLSDQFSELIPLESMRQIYSAGAVVFGGGTDVNPSLYGDNPESHTDFPDFQRDRWEQRVFDRCVYLGIPMIGVCRGAQFLTVMNGGKLIQHTNNHAGNHHKIIDLFSNKIIQANSYHHQMMAPHHSKNRYTIIASAIGPNVDTDPEVVWWPETQCLCIQGHPEWVDTDHEYQVYCKELIQRYIIKG